MVVAVHGTAAPTISRVQVEFDDGHVVDAPLSGGVFGWFYARQPPSLRPPKGGLVRAVLGAEPIRAIGLATSGTELTRQDLPPIRR